MTAFAYVPNSGIYVPVTKAAPVVPWRAPGLRVWWSASDVTTDTGGVDLITDLSGRGNTATQTTSGNRPDLNASDSNLNGQPSITFGASQGMATNIVHASSEWTWYAVVYNAVTSGIRRIVDDGSSGFRFYGSGGNLIVQEPSGSLSLSMGIGAHVVACRVSASGLLRVDAAETTGALTAIDIHNPHLGSRFTNYTSDNWNSEIAKVLGYHAAHSDDQVDEIVEDLGAEFDITVV